MDPKSKHKGESGYSSATKSMRTVIQDFSDNSDNDSMIIKQPVSNREKDKKNPNFSSSKRSSTPNDKMRLFMDHAQRTVDQKKWPGTFYSYGDLSSTASNSHVSSPKNIRQSQFQPVPSQTNPTLLELSQLPADLPSQSIPQSSVSTMQTMISNQIPPLPPEFQQPIEFPQDVNNPTEEPSLSTIHPTQSEFRTEPDSFLSTNSSEGPDEYYKSNRPSLSSQRKYDSRNRAGSLNTQTTTDSVIVNHSVQPPSEPSEAESDEYLADVKERIQQASDLYIQCQESCEQFFCDNTIPANVIEDIDKKDSEERKKLNHVLHKRFDQIVDEKTEEINETLIQCEHELKVIERTRKTSAFDTVVSFLFNSFIEGLSLIGFIPLTIFSFIKHILMMFVEDNGKQTPAIQTTFKQKKSMRYAEEDN